MQRQGWLYALLGLLTGIFLGRQLPFRRKPEPAPAQLSPSPKPGSSSKLARADVLRMIEENGGSEGLVLAGRDLSWIDLSRQVISREAEVIVQRTGEPPVWQDRWTGGINLKGADLTGANLFGANLSCAHLRYAKLGRANLQASCLTKTELSHTDLSGADLSRADLSGAFARHATFKNADLAATDLTGTDIDQSSLKGASLYKAHLSGTRVSRRELGEAILQEDTEALVRFMVQHNPEYDQKMLADKIRERQWAEAHQVYASLKANFFETGNFEDASWAHIKERQMAKKTQAPWRARQYHGQAHPFGRTKSKTYEQLPRWHPLTWWFWLKYTVKWLTDWAMEISCGYGERPLRTLWWTLVIIAIFPILYWLSGGLSSTTGVPLSWLDYLNYSFGAFTTIGFARFETTNWIAETLTSLEALTGISVLALLMFALGNRISRS